ncbi:MAG: DUF4079 domain-containing protein [Elainellaceae cyanobacterium]
MTFEFLPEWVKTGSQFIHPTVMLTLLFFTFYTLYLGIKAQKTRTAEGDEKKELVKGRYGIRHHKLSSILLAIFVLSPLFAMLVTYINNGKLILGPHLVVGLTITGLVAMSASLAPFMQKGNIPARYAHVVLNVGVLGLFSWQVFTGLKIVQTIISHLTTASPA